MPPKPKKGIPIDSTSNYKYAPQRLYHAAFLKQAISLLTMLFNHFALDAVVGGILFERRLQITLQNLYPEIPEVYARIKEQNQKVIHCLKEWDQALHVYENKDRFSFSIPNEDIHIWLNYLSNRPVNAQAIEDNRQAFNLC